MPDRVALVLALLIAAFIAGDFALTGGETLLFLVRRFFDLMDHLVFWD
ncbi:hypothetical protein [Xinfangfangia pollutisoli]|nr:hypothetical protein [Xinfangfangia pollutisoli]